MIRNKNIIVGLDIGSTKICCVVAETGGDEPEIIGLGTHTSRGLRKGVVVNIDATVEAIKRAVEEAELMAGVEVDSVYVGMAGAHISGFNSHGVIAARGSEVTRQDMEKVLEAARAVNIPMDREIIHVLPQEYIVDGQDGIVDPEGINGVRLEAKVHIITASATSVRNIIRSVNRAGLEVEGLVVEQLAASEATLDKDEKELGVTLINMGGGTCDIAVYLNGALRNTAVVPLGGAHITNDVAVGLRTPNHEAEKIKRHSGCATAAMVSNDEIMEVPGVGGREPRRLSRKVLADIIEPRLTEIYTMIREELELSGFAQRKKIASGLVLTGGAAIMQGAPELAEAIFDMPVRMGTPRGIKGLVDLVNGPMYATAVGLVIHGHRMERSGQSRGYSRSGAFNKALEKVKCWAAEFIGS
ncbi:MAG: cell division protein FtsA [Nitrospinota bacterium]|nr:cell division protein FtsA [Nitrospinota bacterium]